MKEPTTVRRISGRDGLGLLLLALLVAALAGCAGPPTLSDVVLTPSANPNAPLGATLTFTTDRKATATLHIDDGEKVTSVTPDEEPVTEHELLVLGLLPDAQHKISVTVESSPGQTTTSAELELTTAPLPDDVPKIEVPIRRPQLMEPGLTLVPVFRWTEVPGEDDDSWGAVYAVDAEGRVRWFLRTDSNISEMRRLRNGNLFFLGGRSGRMFEVDMLGNTVRSWHSTAVKKEDIPQGSIPVDTDTFHHDVIELPNGNFLALSTEARHFDDYPSAYPPSTDTAPAHVIGDVLAEFTPAGEVVRTVAVLDLLDPYRLGYGSLSTGFYEEEYEDVLEEPGKDWAHSNALYFLEEENAVVVSSNMQSMHYKVDWGTGELLWIMGDPSGWKDPWAGKLLQAQGELTWPYHQHGTERTPQGTWILYDNGGERATPPSQGTPPPDRYSRVLELAIDDEAGTVSEVWSYGPEQEWFCSPFISDADWLADTGNVLITDGGRMVGADGKQMTTFGGRNWARVLEVTHGEDSEKVWEMVIDDPSRGYSIYRAQHIYSLYPALDRPTG